MRFGATYSTRARAANASAAMVGIIDGIDQLVISKPILDELLGVLARKFARSADELARVAVFLSEVAEFTRPRRKLRIVVGEADNRILECAVAGKGEAVVTGDKAMLELGEFQGVRILTLRDYLHAA